MSNKAASTERRKKKRPGLLRQGRKLVRLFSLLWPFARGYKGLLTAGFLLSATVILLRAAQPWPLKWIIDSLSGQPTHHHAFPWLSPLWSGALAVLAALYVVVTLLASLAEYGQLMTLAGLGNRVLFAFRAALYTHVLRQSLSFHEKKETGELLTRIVYDTSRLRRGVNGILTRVFQTFLSFFVTLMVLFWLDPRLTAVVLVAGVFVLATMGRSTRRIFRASRKQRKKEGKLAALVAEKLLGVRELQTFQPASSPDDHFARHNTQSLKQEQKVRRLAALLLVRVELVLALCITLILWLGSNEVQAGRLTPGDLVLFVSYVLALYRPFTQFSKQMARSGKTFASADRLIRIMNKQPKVADQPDAQPAGPLQGALGLEGVWVRSSRKLQASRPWVLEDNSLAIQPGERVGVLGHNGAGKSTLLRLFLRLMDPDKGRVLVDGRGLKEFTLDSVRQQVSVVFQDSVFFGLTVAENIAFGRLEATRKEIEETARRCQLHPLIQRLPKGYDTVVEQRGKLFSVGERQRIAIARALLRNGRVWLLDEPSSGLDQETADELMNLLFDVTENRTLVCVTHNSQMLKRFDRVVVLGEGKVQFQGSPEEYWQSQRERHRRSAAGSQVVSTGGEDG